MAKAKIFLITGTNRGLGHALTSALLLRPHHIVIATTRFTSTPQSLSSLPTHPTTTMIHVPLSFPSGSAGSDLSVNHAISAFAALSSTHPEVTHIDVVIANAGTSSPRVPILDVTPDRLLGSLAVNSLAPLLLFQAAWPLLQKADNPKFVAIGSIVGSVVGVEETGGWADAAYGTSKAAGNYLVRKLGKEMEEAVAVCVVHPGWIQTDMGNARAVEQGLKEAPVTLKESVEGIFEEIDRMGKGKDCGFRTFDHKDIAW